MTATMTAKPANTYRTLPITSLRFGGETQARAATCAETVKEYTDALQSGAKFPPVIVYHDALNLYYVGDGTHRVMATLETGGLTIECEVRQGGLIEAKKYACSANKSHGLKRTNADKRKAVVMYWELVKDENPRPSNTAIADWCGVVESFVRKVIKEKKEDPKLTSHKAKSTVGKDGRTINTSNIGKNTKPDPKPEPDQESEDAIDSEPEAEPEAAPEPGAIMLDSAGHAVPERLRQVFEQVAEWHEIKNIFNGLAKKIHDMASHPSGSGKLLRMMCNSEGSAAKQNWRIRDLSNVKNAIRFSKPFSICPKCAGQDKPDCNGCSGAGWVSETNWVGASDDLKSRLEVVR